MLQEGDRTSLFYVARSLMKLQTIFGIIPKIQGKGTCARVIVPAFFFSFLLLAVPPLMPIHVSFDPFQLVADMMIRMRREIGSEEAPTAPEIENLILIDRNVDLLTPMCSQLTYEGLIDEYFGIFNSTNQFTSLFPGNSQKTNH